MTDQVQCFSSRYRRDMITLCNTIRRAPTILLGIVGSLVIVGLCLIWTASQGEALHLSHQTATIRQTATATATSLGLILDERYGDLVVLRNTIQALPPTTRLDAYFRSFLASYPVYGWVGIVDHHYRVLTSSSQVVIPHERLAALFDTEGATTQPRAVLADDPMRQHTLSLYLRTAPLVSPHTPPRFVLAIVPLDSLQKIINELTPLTIDHDLEFGLFTDTTSLPIISTPLFRTLSFVTLTGSQSALTTGQHILEDPHEHNQDLIVAYHHIPTRLLDPTTWHLVLAKSRLAMIAPQRLWTHVAFAMTGVFGVMGLAILFHIYRCLHSSHQATVSTAAALEASDADTALLINSSLDAVITINEQGIVTQWNRQAEQIFGWTADEAIGTSLSERIIPPAHRAAHERGLQTLRTQQDSPVLNRRMEVPALHRDGHVFPIELTIHPLRRHQTRFYTAFIRDLTELKRSERQTAIHSRINRLLAESTDFSATCTEILKTLGEPLEWQCALLWIPADTDSPSRMLHVCATWCHPEHPAIRDFTERRRTVAIPVDRQTIGSASPLQGPRLYDRVDPTDLHEACQEAFRSTGLTQALVFPLVVDHTVRAVCEFYRTASRTDPKDLERLLTLAGGAMAQYIDRVAKNEALRLSEERFERAVRGSHDGLYDWNIVTDEMYLSPRFKAILGYADNELPNSLQSLHSHLHPDDLTPTIDAIHHHLTTRDPFDREVRCRTKSGEYRWVRIRGEALWDHQGRPLHMAGAISDVTKQRHEAEELRRAKEQAEAASIAKTQFLAMMSHELRTPLNPVIALADLLACTLQTKPEQDYAHLILTSAKSLLTLINRVLDCAKLEHGDLTLQQAPFDLHALLRNLSELFTAQAAAKGLALRLSIDPDSPHQVIGDRERLHQIIANLVGNAVKFTETGSIDIQLLPAAPPMTVTILVKDTGIGIDPAHHQAIFQPFTQVDLSSTRNYEGTGLGLAIAYQLTQLMQGTLTVDSALGTGSTFTLTLPLVSANPISTSQNNHDPLPHIDLTAPPLTHDAILIVDDQPTNCLVAQTILTKLGYRSEVAQSGSEALDRFRHRRYPLAFIDIHMPDLDGYEVVRQIRELERDRGLPHTPLIALTAKALASDRAQCLAAGFDDYLPKPCTLDDYRRILSRWVGSSMSAGADDPLASLRDALRGGDYPALRRLALALQQEAESHQQMARALIAASIAMQADKQRSDRIPALLAQLEQTYSSRDATTA